MSGRADERMSGRADARVILYILLSMSSLVPPAHAQRGVPLGQGRESQAQATITREVRLDQRLDSTVAKDATFRDETGKPVRIGDYLGTRPIMLILIQYRCTMLCSEEMKALAASLKALRFTAGEEFTLLTVSIDPREPPALAMEYKRGYLKDYNRPSAERGWHFLTGDEPNISRLADSIGYHYRYDSKTDQYAHPDGVIVLTPQGKIARYFFRLNYPARDLRLGLIEAASNRIGTPLDYFSLLCYHYNPATGTYGIAILGMVRLAGLATVVLILACVITMILRDRRARRLTLNTQP